MHKKRGNSKHQLDQGERNVSKDPSKQYIFESELVYLWHAPENRYSFPEVELLKKVYFNRNFGIFFKITYITLYNGYNFKRNQTLIIFNFRFYRV